MAHSKVKRTTSYVYSASPEASPEEVKKELYFLRGMGIDTEKNPVIITKQEARLYNMFLGLNKKKKETQT